MNLTHARLDSTPPRPRRQLDAPRHVLRMGVTVDTAHLGNPLLAVQRLLASEAGAFAHVTGDESSIEVAVALPDDDPTAAALTEEWVRWVIHNAGIRGTVAVAHTRA